MQDASELFERRTLRQSLHEFFYREEVPYSMALLRILLPLVLLVVVIPRWIHSRELYSTDGAPAQLALNYGWANFFPEPNGTTAVALMTILSMSLVTSAVGWKTRTSLLISAVLFGYLNMLDCLSSMTKYSVISTHLLVLLGMSNCGALWSIDCLSQQNELRRRSVLGLETSLPVASIWPQRLIQLLIGLIYFGAATTKLQTEAYFTSDQLRWWMITNVNRANPIGEWLSMFPSLLIVMAYAAIIWQIIFVFVSRRGIGRIFALGFGTTFHLSTGPLLGIYVFPMVMISSYVSFLQESDMQRIGRWFRRHRVVPLDWSQVAIEWLISRTCRLPDAATCGTAYACVLLTATVVGVAAEYALDPYCERRPEGKLPLPVLEAGFLEQVPREPESIRESDKFYTVAIGTQLLGKVMLDSKTEFQPGEKFLVQASLTLLHNDLWIECNLHDSDDRLLHRSGQIVTRERMRAEWQYEVGSELQPGTYWIVLKSSGQEMTRRPITVK